MHEYDQAVPQIALAMGACCSPNSFSYGVLSEKPDGWPPGFSGFVSKRLAPSATLLL